MEILLLIPVLIGFVLTALFLPKWIKKSREVGLLWEDMNKVDHPQNVAGSGGVVVVFAFVLGVLSYVAVKTFVFGGNGEILEIFSLLSVILILAIVGLTDDLLGWKHGGLSIKFRLFLALMASVPLVVINVGNSLVRFPFIGTFDVGLIYSLLIVPIGIAGATTTYNFLAGFNGLEAGQGIIILSFLSLISYITGSSWLALIGLIMVACLLVFYVYNKVPAKVFPGDSLTYSIGALIACMAILGNFERIALFVFIPYVLETGLKLRGKLRRYSFGIPENKRSLKLPYKKVYGLTHLSILILSKFKREVGEKDVIYLIFIFQIFICLIALILFRNLLF